MYKQYLRKNASIIVGISIPIVMILFVACSIYLPALFIQPKYNFLYMNNSEYYGDYGWKYDVQDDRLVRKVVNHSYSYESPIYSMSDEPGLYIYDVAKNDSTKVTFTEADQLDLSPQDLSPDGFKVLQGNGSGGGFFPFFNSNNDYSTYYLNGNNVNKKLNIQLSGNDTYSFRFLGWVK